MKDMKSVVIGALLIAIMFMSAGYATLTSRLTIDGNATIDGKWKVEITDITPVYSGEASDTDGNPISTATTATFDTKLVKPGDAATYTITVKNSGTITAKLNGFVLTPAAGSEAIKYEVVSSPEENSTLSANGTATFVVKVSYDSSVTEMPEELTRSCTGTIEYVQAS